jgi:hypothetical protein
MMKNLIIAGSAAMALTICTSASAQNETETAEALAPEMPEPCTGEA